MIPPALAVAFQMDEPAQTSSPRSGPLQYSVGVALCQIAVRLVSDALEDQVLEEIQHRSVPEHRHRGPIDLANPPSDDLNHVLQAPRKR